LNSRRRNFWEDSPLIHLRSRARIERQSLVTNTPTSTQLRAYSQIAAVATFVSANAHPLVAANDRSCPDCYPDGGTVLVCNDGQSLASGNADASQEGASGASVGLLHLLWVHANDHHKGRLSPHTANEICTATAIMPSNFSAKQTIPRTPNEIGTFATLAPRRSSQKTLETEDKPVQYPYFSSSQEPQTRSALTPGTAQPIIQLRFGHVSSLQHSPPVSTPLPSYRTFKQDRFRCIATCPGTKRSGARRISEDFLRQRNKPKLPNRLAYVQPLPERQSNATIQMSRAIDSAPSGPAGIKPLKFVL